MPKTSRSSTISSLRTQTDDRTKACCKVLVGLWSVMIMLPYHVPKTKTFLLLLTTLNCTEICVASGIVALQFHMIQITMTLNYIMNLICRFICIDLYLLFRGKRFLLLLMTTKQSRSFLDTTIT